LGGAKGLGYFVGTCADRPVRHQQSVWERQQIAVDFTVLKHRLADVAAHGSSSLTLFAEPPGCRPA
jgi:hypothetical protein